MTIQFVIFSYVAFFFLKWKKAFLEFWKRKMDLDVLGQDLDSLLLVIEFFHCASNHLKDG